jgi:hypothetical protein
MWPFASKEAAYQLNQLSLRSDGQSCEAIFFNVDKDFINPTFFMHLDHHALFWIQDFNWGLQVHQNGTLDLDLAFMSDIHPLMLAQYR